MSSMTKLPKKPFQIKPKASRINPIKAIQDREWNRKRQAEAQARAAAAATPPPTAGGNSGCPNPNCKNPNVIDGVCRTCGRVTDDSNIVSEVTFGENSQGGAVVQGSFLGADQGTVRGMAGIGSRRVAGHGSGESRERTLREARQMMSGFAHQLNIPEHVVSNGHQIYKLASGKNFVQGRRIPNVVAVSLYAACRKESPCKIMLIDLADIVKEEVFYLGRTYKKLLSVIEAKMDQHPIYVEDLIFRFASKLEFDTLTNKVAETAVRLVQRMDRDWMVMGRRPAGICGACLIMAARMYNFRRTPREVVYIAKITMATLQQRLDEFRELPSARMTVEDFLSQDFLSEEYDPPSIYKKSEEYQARLKEKRRAMKRKRQAEEAAEASSQSAPTPAPPLRTDADGFAIPPPPQATAQAQQANIIERAGTTTDEDLEALAAEYGDKNATTGVDGNDDDDAPDTPSASPDSPASSTSERPAKRRKGPQGSSCRTQPASKTPSVKPVYMDEAWEEDEDILEMEITEAINDQNTEEHAKAFASAKEQVQRIMQNIHPPDAADASAASALDNAVVGEDEFADDPEVQNCLLSKEEQEIKSRIWLNENKDWLRHQQEKIFRQKLAANGPPKQRRNRVRKPRIGEGQASPASTAGEAAMDAMERRGFSKRINYDAIASMLHSSRRAGPGSVAASEYTSRQSSRAGSVAGSAAGDEPADDESEAGYDEEEEAPGEDRDPFADSDGGGGSDEE
ncbi:uncharacterized protein E0L32_012275 [Thyridium curvatum]|uniref:Cyclin-like domain-containing protein n=1 Tax=Thyridium curvatum TaxID=1093900 RepID=A0A507B482_9PEZI|nr:uncharacterized protein E0L32_012275 [Thyridium curvatum]TPX17062.1 hypothetical protein E0L32_012275 [Thyridium curvatum]